jgi:hypothetical protein
MGKKPVRVPVEKAADEYVGEAFAGLEGVAGRIQAICEDLYLRGPQLVASDDRPYFRRAVH